MKTIQHLLFTGISILFLLSVNSCQKLTEINENPNEAATTHPQALLSKVEWETFRVWHGTTPLYILKMIVQTDGENANQLYNWQRGGFGEYQQLRNVQKMMEEAEKLNETNYIALGKFFRAYYFYNLTLFFGDIPYSEALQGESASIFQPKYDSQEAVFQGILTELEEAVTLLKDNPNPMDGDIIYNGNPNKWIALINAFRLKVLMTLSKHEESVAMDIRSAFAAIYAAEPLLQSIEDDGQLAFLDQQDVRYPEFNSSSYGSGMYMDSTFIRRLQDHKDPRLFVIATQTRLGREAGAPLDDFSSYEGGDPIAPYAQVNDKAVAGRLSKVHDRYTDDPTNEPFVLMGYAEQQFILAEATVRGWISGDAKALYNEGIRASFAFYAAYAKNLGAFVAEDKVETYIAQTLVDLDDATSTEAKLERIMMQKYLRSFHQGGYSSYFDHLRTGYPTLRKAANVQVAYRWMYPQTEYNQNTQHVNDAIQRQFDGDDNIHSQPWWLN
ncbi:SusD/RagB family nutrient-binding outer membrane lipoprotein [Sphingobacterium phlebotomi]|uniref:SusD/RagB family nutrient-binding outer membrane lipoprotein n=1 Tax=Sphingobacterium phlebotomi TaxID=2605433 RepID=A0A5D4H8W8_9SPHI|nr:SusD/RagB family nutrient-binding outer membrane lipoprotein [Sphingobacterium phlebotomi]TYR36663.1 SusD/RagB family nutrient-binding outer membrane lipoprotein [Sphingobacterium phlebotomi]